MDEDKDSPRGFRVTDRRRFSEEGAERPGDETAPDTGSAPEPLGAPEPVAGAVGDPVNFTTFLLGLSTQALLLLGDIQDPASGPIARDLGAAKHVIDILAVLKDKTRGNLEQAEEELLEHVLYDLRMRFVELARGPSKEGA